MVSGVKLLRAFGKYCNGDIKAVKKNISLIGKNQNGSAYRLFSDGNEIIVGFDKNGNLIKRIVKNPGETFDFRRYRQFKNEFERINWHTVEAHDFRTGKTVKNDITKTNYFKLNFYNNTFEMLPGVKTEISKRIGNIANIQEVYHNPVNKYTEVINVGTLKLDA